jgi:hypothetical protein
MRHWAFTVIVALLILGLDGPQLAQGARAVVIVHNRARLPNHQIADALGVVRRIYSRAGLDLTTLHANSESDNVLIDDLKIRIIVLSKEAARAFLYPPDTVGFTPRSEGRRARLAYILEDRVSAVSRGYNVRPEIVLGAAIAHEIGHMLLSRGHTSEGLMRAQFNQTDFRRIAAGELHFTEIEAADIRRPFPQSIVELRASADASKR